MPSAKTRAITFAKTHNLPLFALEDIQCEQRDNGTWKKKLKYYSRGGDCTWGFPNEMYQNGSVLVMGKDIHFAVKTGLLSRVIVLDFDDEEYYHKTIDNLVDEDDDICPELTNTLTVKTRKGYHVYLRVPDDKEMFANSTNVWNSPVDIRGEGGNILCPPTSYEVDGEEIEYVVYKDVPIASMSSMLYELLEGSANVKIYGKSYTDEISGSGVVGSKKSTVDIGRLTDLLNLLPDDYCKDYNAWFTIGAIIATETNKSDEGLQLFMDVSRKASGYETTPDSEYIQKWNEYECGKVSSGSLVFILRSLGISIPYDTPTEWFGVDADNDDPGFDSIKMIEIQKKLTDAQQTIYDKKESERTPEERKELNDLLSQNYKKMKKYFEKYHFFNYGTECIVRIEPDKSLKFVKNHNVTYADCLIQYEPPSRAKFVDRWIKDVYKRSYGKIDFYPPPQQTPNRVYNSFTPFDIEMTPSPDTEGDCPEILEHIRSLVNYDDDCAKYVLAYLAHMVQKPGEIPKVALVFKSKEGAGKSSFFEKIGKVLLGSRYYLQTDDIDKIVGRFSMIRDKILVCKDEMSGKDGYANVESLKHLITEETMTIEKKGIDGETIHNYIRLLFFTNNDTPLKISESDRRYAVFEASDKYIGNVSYFKNLHAKLSDKVYMRRFYDALMSLDISDWNASADRPQTDIYKEMKMANIPPLKRFMRQYIEERVWSDASSTGGMDDNPRTELIEVLGADLYKEMRRWCCRTRIAIGRDGETTISITKFGRDLKKLPGITSDRTRKGRMYTINTEEALSGLPECE